MPIVRVPCMPPWSVLVTLHNILNVPRYICENDSATTHATSSTAKAPELSSSKLCDRVFVVKLAPCRVSESSALKPCVARFTPAHVTEFAPGVREVRLDKRDPRGTRDHSTSSNNNSTCHKARFDGKGSCSDGTPECPLSHTRHAATTMATRAEANPPTLHLSTSRSVWHTSSPTVDVMVTLYESPCCYDARHHSVSTDNDSKREHNETDRETLSLQHTWPRTGRSVDNKNKPNSRGGTSRNAHTRDSATRDTSRPVRVRLCVVGQSARVTIPVQRVVEHDKLLTRVVGTSLGQVAISIRVDSGDVHGYRHRLRTFLTTHYPAGLCHVERIVAEVPELDTFARLYKKYGCSHDYAQRVADLVHLYGADYADEIPGLLYEWNDNEYDLIHHLVLNNGPEPRDIDPRQRLGAFMQRYALTPENALVKEAEAGCVGEAVFARLRHLFGPEPDPRTYLFTGLYYTPPVHYPPCVRGAVHRSCSTRRDSSDGGNESRTVHHGSPREEVGLGVSRQRDGPAAVSPMQHAESRSPHTHGRDERQRTHRQRDNHSATGANDHTMGASSTPTTASSHPNVPASSLATRGEHMGAFSGLRAVDLLAQGWMAVRRGAIGRARDYWEHVTRTHGPDTLPGSKARAFLAEVIDTDYPSAAHWYDRCLELHEEDGMVLYNYAILLDAVLGRPGEALGLYERAARCGEGAAAARARQLRMSLCV